MLFINSISAQTEKEDPIAFGQSLRAGYLLSDKLIVSGSGDLAIDHEKYFSNPSAKLKKSMVLGYSKRLADPNYKKEIERMYESMKKGKSVKHPTKDMIVTLARCNRILDQFYESSIIDMRNAFALCGYAGLNSLKEEGLIETVGAGDIHDDSKPHSYGETLAAKWDRHDEIYSIMEPLWDYTKKNNLTISENGGDPDAQFFSFHLVNIPLLNYFTAGELKAIRNEVFGDANRLREAIANWSLQLKGEDFSPANATAYNAHYQANILPLIHEFEGRIAGCALFDSCKQAVREVGTENYLAITSAKTIWEFMAWSGMVPKPDMHDFELYSSASANAGKAVLLVLSKRFNNKPIEEADITDKKALRL